MAETVKNDVPPSFLQLLVELAAALDEACDLADEGFSRGWDHLDRQERLKRIAELRRVPRRGP